ncbi:MAG TPA: queuosine precursor transporter [Phycisphaerales bacterium]|nr:queuosine precursor transporter [Phycisphaerales bacterium]
MTHSHTSHEHGHSEGQDERKRQLLFIMLAGFFLSNAILAELIGGKLFEFQLSGFRFILSVGVLIWPAVFIMTDIINEYFGRAGVRRLSLLGAAMIAYAYLALFATRSIRAAGISPVQDSAFNQVFFQSQWIIVGSIVAFLVSQLVDVTVFWALRRATGHKWLWLRAQGSTAVSQLIDTFIVQFIGLYLPWKLGYISSEYNFHTYLVGGTSSYAFKLGVAVMVTPVLYIVHGLIDAWLGRRESEEMIERTAAKEQS